MTGGLYVVRVSDGYAVQCSGAAAALGYLRRGGVLVSGDRLALLRLEAEEHGRVEAGLDEAVWRAVGGLECR